MQQKGRIFNQKKQTNELINFFFFRSSSMTFLCRFNQRNRLIEVPSTSEYYNQQNGISHENLKQLISIKILMSKYFFF